MNPDAARTWMASLGGRRFILTVGCGLITSLLCWFGKISDQVYATVILATVAAYIGANTIQKQTEIRESAPFPPAPKVADTVIVKVEDKADAADAR